MRGRKGAAGAALLLALGPLACADEPGPSILLVSLDTLRADHVGAYGDTRGLTPNLDALAARGLVHEAAYTTMPTTGPAHVSAFTGLLPSEHGVRRNGRRLAPERAERSAVVRLREAGYATAAFVTSAMMTPAATGLTGFEIHDVPRGIVRPGDRAVQAALAWLERERRRPVLLFVHLYDAHAPYGGAGDERVSAPLPARRHGWVDPAAYEPDAARKEMARLYAAGVRAADAALGTLLEGVRDRLEEPPLVLVVSDHGETLDERLAERGFAYDHGEFLDPETVEILLVAAGPGVETGRSRGAVSIRDLHDTLLGAAGLLDPGEISRDLRRRSDARRLVTIERRDVGLVPLEKRRSMLRHAAAAGDGRRLVIVDDEGRPDGPEADPALVEAARRALRTRDDAAAEPAAEPVDPSLREALESLGYGE